VSLSLLFAGGNEADKYLGSNRQERLKLFNEYVTAIKSTQVVCHKGLKNLGTTWEKELARSRQRFLNARTFKDTYCALVSLQRSYHDPHSRLVGIGYNSEYGLRLPFILRAEFNNNNWEYVVTNSSLPDIRSGYVLKSMNGKTTSQLEYEFLEWFNDHSKEQLIMDLADNLTGGFACFRDPKVGENVSLVFFDPEANKEHTVNTKWQKSSDVKLTEDNEYSGFKKEFSGINYDVYATDERGTKIVHYYSFYYGSADINKLQGLSYKVEKYDTTNYSENAIMIRDEEELVGYLKNKGTKNILIDVRDNHGGDLPRHTLLPNLAKKDFFVDTAQIYYMPVFKGKPGRLRSIEDIDFKPKAIEFFEKNPHATRSPVYPFFCQTKACDLSEIKYKTLNPNNDLNIVVVSGPECSSSCDDFVRRIKDNNIGKVVGLSGDASGSPTRYTYALSLKDGTEFSIKMTIATFLSPDGKKDLEGDTVKVDIPIYPSKDNRGNYIRSVLKFLRTNSIF
jgi:hypothetical protein